MKKTILLFTLLGASLLLFSQNNPGPANNKYFGGVAFDYFQTKSELSAYSSSNTIDGESFGWTDWTENEISDLNNYVRTTQTWMAPSLVFGMNIIEKPENPWSLSGEAMLGYLLLKHDEEDKNTGDNLLEVKNDGKVNLFGNLDFRLNYSIKKWQFTFNPAISTGIAHSSKVTYNYLPEGSYDTEYDITTKFYYPKVNLMAAYAFGNISTFAGAGYGAYYGRQNLEVFKTTVHQSFSDEMKIDFEGLANFNAVLGFDWLFAEKFLWKVKSEIGVGFHGQTSISILF